MGHFDNQMAGSVGGTCLAFIGIIDMQDMVKTMILACIGAVVSFAVSALLKWLFSNKQKSKS